MEFVFPKSFFKTTSMPKITGVFAKYAYLPRNFSSWRLFKTPIMLKITGIFAKYTYLPRNFSSGITF